jgi:hypothetical protein
VTNPALRDMVRRAGVPYARLAATINRVGAENGQRLYYDASSISHWMSGTVPRLDVIPVLAEVFTRLLGRPVEPGELGLPVVAGEDAMPDGPWAGDPVIWLERLGRDDMFNRRTMLTGGLYSLAALTLPGPLTLTTRHGEPRRTGPGDVRRVEEMTERFSVADDLYGGGHARAAVAAYLTLEVAPLLHGSSGRARPALFRAASRLAYLAGYMAHDAAREGLAQRYFIQSVRLAGEAEDQTTRATALHGLALQACQLGHTRQAVDLAEAAETALPSAAPPRTQAWMAAMCAEAYAASGDRDSALATLRRADIMLERADSLPRHDWTGAYDRAGLEHQTGKVLAYLGDLPAAERHMADAVTARRGGQRRLQVLVTARLARVQVKRGHPDQAATTLLALADDLPLLTSGRVTGELTALRAGWVTSRSDPTVERADRLIAALPAR